MARTSSASPTALRFYFFGSVRIECASSEITLPTRKIESLLAYLALHPEPHAREKLAALLWGDVPDVRARGSLRKALTLLRKQLGDDVLIADRDNVQLNPQYNVWVDVREFQWLVHAEPEAALALYTGDLLADWYDDWVLAERERCGSAYVETLLRLTQEMRAQGEFARAIAFAQRVLVRDRANERAYQHLMFCHMMSGQREAALHEYQKCRRALAEELAVEPAPETTALYHWVQETPAKEPAFEARITNLPLPLTSFIGRESAITRVRECVECHPLVTLTGAGGCGKTRLAIQVATDLIDQFKDGVWWVDLAPLMDEALIPYQVAKVLGVADAAQRSPEEALTSWLRTRRLLLVLDNCEHLVAACARLTTMLLGECGDIKVLTTSREAMGLTGEVVWHVASLSMPERQSLLSLAGHMSFESIRLFVERARAIQSGFMLTEQNAAAVRQICRQLDGIPLAIELAAARINALSAEQIAARLDDRFNLLTQGSRTALPRYRTLRAAMDWSYDLLSDEERVLYRRLAAFSGGWTLEAAETVCEGGGVESTKILGLLSRLVDKSLVIVNEVDGAARYQMLETVRQYAHERLLESGEAEIVQRRHLAFYKHFAQATEPKLYTTGQERWFRRLESEQDNFRVALEWAQVGGDVRAGLEIAGALPSGSPLNTKEGRARFESLLAAADPAERSAMRAKALVKLGDLCFALGDYACAHLRLREALEICRELGDASRAAEALYILGMVAYYQHRYWRARILYQASLATSRAGGARRITADALHMLGHVMDGLGECVQAHDLFEESVSRYRELGDYKGLALPLSDLAREAQHAGDFDKARSIFEENLGVFEQSGEKWGMGLMLADLGYLALATGDPSAAEKHLRKSLSLFTHLGDKRFIAECLEGLGGLAAAQRQPARAARLLGAAEALRQATGIPVPPYRQPDYDRFQAVVREALEPAAVERELGRGRTQSLDQAIAYALDTKMSA